MFHSITARRGFHWHKILHPVASVLMLTLVSACANGVATPVAVSSLPPEKIAVLRVHDIVGEAGPGVAMTPADLTRISAQVTAQIRADSPQVLQSEGGPSASVLKMYSPNTTRATHSAA